MEPSPKGGIRSSCVTGGGFTGLEEVIKDLRKKLNLLAHWVSHFPLSLSLFPFFKMEEGMVPGMSASLSKTGVPLIPRSRQGSTQARLCINLFSQPQAAFIVLPFPLSGAASLILSCSMTLSFANTDVPLLPSSAQFSHEAMHRRNRA